MPRALYAALEIHEVEAMVRRLGFDPATLEIRKTEDIAPAIESLKGRVQALYVVSDILVYVQRIRVNSVALAAQLPTMDGFREYIEAGGLMSYGANLPDLWRQAAVHVDKILRGAKPDDLPVEQPTKFDLVINSITPSRWASPCHRRCSPAPTR